jgi:hypothetical protein
MHLYLSMERIGKTFTIFLALTIAMSCLTLLTVKPANAQSNDSPSPPQFTIKYIDNSIQVQPTTTVDPYSGKTIVNKGYLIVNKTIELIILNQPTSDAGVYYTIRAKGHFEENWTQSLYYYSQNLNMFFRSTNEQTEGFYVGNIGTSLYVPSDGKLDIQLQAVQGGYFSDRPDGAQGVFKTFGVSGWSNIGTLILPDGSVTTTPFLNPPTTTPTSTPSVPEFSWLMLLPLFIFTLLIAVKVRFRKTWRITQK